MKDVEIALILLEEMENHFSNTRVSKGFGIGHPHFAKKLPKSVLGSSAYEAELEEEPEVKDKTEKVQVSKAFKKWTIYNFIATLLT